MNKYLFRTMLALIVLLAGICILTYWHFREKLNENQTRTNRLEGSLLIFNDNFKSANKLRLKYTDTKIPSETIIVDSNGKESKFKELFGSSRSIVFYFSESNCDVCVKRELGKIKKIISGNVEIGKKIKIISKYSFERSLKAFKVTNNIDFEIYNIKGDGLLKEVDSPFYFIIDADYLYKDLLFPFKDLPDITGIYVNEMYVKLFKSTL